MLRGHTGTGTLMHADELGGSALRLLHQLSISATAAEALSRSSPPALPLLRRAMGLWGLGGRVLALETLKRALVLINRCVCFDFVYQEGFQTSSHSCATRVP